MTTHVTRSFVFALAAVAAVPSVAAAQAPPPAKPRGGQAEAPAPTAAPPAGQAAPNPNLPVPPANFEYAFDGRRDPFLSLVNRGADPRATGAQPVKRAEGVPGLMTTEITVRGIVQTRGQFVAMVAGVDGKVFSVRAGDRLADGVVREVTAQSVVILQEVNDPLSLDKQREVRKLLRGGEEVK
jgi:Tfp pilus assembly protein PilP